jgi:hypothetical protein
MEPETLEVLFGANFHVIQVNTNGITHEDSIVQPCPAGNCMNWVLGHIVAYRSEVLKLVGKPPIWSDEEASPYRRGSKPITDAAKARPVTRIIEDLVRSQDALICGLRSLSPEDMKRDDLGEKITWLQFHEAYHAGQIGLLRRMAGKEGMIR